MAKKKKPKESGSLTAEDVLISVIIALAVCLALFIVILVVGLRLSPGSFQRPAASNPPVASQPARVPPQAPVQTAPPQQPSAPPTPTPKAEQAPAANTNDSGKERRSSWESGAYLGSSESDKYHDYECRAAKNILPENEVWFTSEDQAKAAGYSRCGICW